MSALLYAWAGRVDYDTGYKWQAELVRARAGGQMPDTLLALEHPPTYTTGTRTYPGHLPAPDVLARHGAVLRQSDRGGSITYHGPGQLVGYCIVHRSSFAGDLHRYVRVVEQALIFALHEWGIQAGCLDGYTGVWVGDAKIASIGLRVTRGVTMHGFALNLTNDLAPFGDIAACGLTGRAMCSAAGLGVVAPPPPVATATIAAHLAALLGHAECLPLPAEEVFLALARR